jgi:hypothetical protein
MSDECCGDGNGDKDYIAYKCGCGGYRKFCAPECTCACCRPEDHK